jgi:hypothetical protein
LDLGATLAGTGFSTSFTTLPSVQRQVSWNGVISLGLTNSSSTILTDITLVSEELSTLTGLNTAKHRMSRPDHCPRCAKPMWREDLVKDGYTKSLVCEDCWDPPDMTGKHKVPQVREIDP